MPAIEASGEHASRKARDPLTHTAIPQRPAIAAPAAIQLAAVPGCRGFSSEGLLEQ